MRKVIAAINISLDAYCDHTMITPDEELHEHYTALLRQGSIILYGRVTFQLMEFWPTLLEKPSGNPSMDEFAQVMDRIPKLVFSRTLSSIDWHSATLASRSPEEELIHLKSQPGGDILVGSPGLIDYLSARRLIDEYQLCVHPLIAGKGLPLFRQTSETLKLRLMKTKQFNSGAMLLYYNAP